MAEAFGLPEQCVANGTTMLLHCDYLVLADDAQLTTPFVGLALVPEAASSFLLPARIGYARAFVMFALSEPVAPGDALAWGLANRVVPREGLVAAAAQIAASLARQPIGALLATKRLMRPAEAIARQLEVESRLVPRAAPQPRGNGSVQGVRRTARTGLREVRVNQGRNPSARNMTRRFFARAISVVRLSSG